MINNGNLLVIPYLIICSNIEQQFNFRKLVKLKKEEFFYLLNNCPNLQKILCKSYKSLRLNKVFSEWA